MLTVIITLKSCNQLSPSFPSTLASMKSRMRDILVPAWLGCPGKWPLCQLLLVKSTSFFFQLSSRQRYFLSQQTANPGFDQYRSHWASWLSNLFSSTLCKLTNGQTDSSDMVPYLKYSAVVLCRRWSATLPRSAKFAFRIISIVRFSSWARLYFTMCCWIFKSDEHYITLHYCV